MNSHCGGCAVEDDCVYPYKPCECCNYRKFVPQASAGLPIWTIYSNPADFPGRYVARMFLNDQPTRAVLDAASLDVIRLLIPPGLFCMVRHPDDDPVIVETWF